MIPAEPPPAPAFPLAEADQRYQQWSGRLRDANLLPDEFLLPQLRVACPQELPPLMRIHPDALPEVRHDALSRIMRRLGPWGYGIQLAPGLVTESHPQAIQRMTYRAHLINGAVTQLLGEELEQATVADISCGHGYFPLELAHLGVKSALGIDVQAGNIDKAHFLMRHFGVGHVAFRKQEVHEWAQSSEVFDVVLNLGLLYHHTDLVSLARTCHHHCCRFAVFDSLMLKEPVSAFIQRVKPPRDRPGKQRPPGAKIELVPTYRAVIDLLLAAGFEQVIEVLPQRFSGKPEARHPLYERLERRCLIGVRKGIAVPELTAAPQRAPTPAEITSPTEAVENDTPVPKSWWEKLRAARKENQDK